eukprot:COSAG02_NODE_40076_length_409_cov_1.116129_1_plen_33_part_01
METKEAAVAMKCERIMHEIPSPFFLQTTTFQNR